MKERFIGEWSKLGWLLGLGCSLYYSWVALVGITLPALDRSLFIYIGIAVAICLKPLGRSLALRLVDAVLLAAASAATVYFNANYTDYMNNAGLGLKPIDMVLGIAITLISIEASRRVLGLWIPVISLVFLAYLFAGPWMPGALRHGGFDLDTVVSNLYASTEGLYGVITYVLASTLFLFLVFGQFLVRSGASDFFSDLCLSFLGRRPGGGAKASVASSLIVGSVTGSAAANVAITGVLTIPLMKRTGYAPHIAAATEAAASTGGTVMPPVMGAAAFIMVALTGIPYATIALLSAVPALVYFLCVYLQVHFYAKRHGLAGLPAAEVPAFWAVWRRGWVFVAPLVVVVALVFAGYSLARIALLGMVTCVLCSWLDRRTRMGWRAILDALAEGTKHGLSIIAVAGPVSVMTLAILLPGTGLKITGILIDLGGSSIALTMGIIFVIAYILGMGLSMVPAYIILTTLAAPALIRMDVPVIAAHFVVMWWSQASNITPPVALASYVAANIAGSPLWQTGNAAVVKGAGLFFLPLLFVYQPGFLFEGSALEIASTIGSVLVGVLMISAAIEGYLTRALNAGFRIAYGVAGGLLIIAHEPHEVAILLVFAGALHAFDRWHARRASTLTQGGLP
ncbi:MAG TPA: TRAP transporter fused permease subunit [Burkholderiales bacterium]|jgi:TRAP transporter 4TM/12TM fusion protein|nr:TRAP transporter fused permease subunit [Burkholderiales bacterium]